MDLLVNELSVHEQFHDLAGFQDALSGLMALRAAAKRFGCEVQCRRALCNAMPIRNMSMQQAIGRLGLDAKRSFLSWLNHSGPFWDDLRQHGEDDWLERGGDIVTDTTVGEAAFRILHGVPCGLVSLAPSDWCRSPLDVTLVHEAEGADNCSAKVENWWCAKELGDSLKHHASPLRSWDELREVSTSRFATLAFAKDCFAPLEGVPFKENAANRFVMLLDVLDRLARAVDDDGKRNAKGQSIYQDYFTGDNAWFSDSSDSEKQDFRQELTFADPEDSARTLFCSWHGKVRHPTFRIHFSGIPKAGKPVYIVYAGPKITRR